MQRTNPVHAPWMPCADKHFWPSYIKVRVQGESLGEKISLWRDYIRYRETNVTRHKASAGSCMEGDTDRETSSWDW